MKRKSRRLSKQGLGEAGQEPTNAPLPPPETPPAAAEPELIQAQQMIVSEASAAPEIVDPVKQAATRSWHYLVLAAIPAILSILNRNWMFQNGVHMDPWSYFGLFQHFPRFHNLVWNYMGERIAWIAPGYLLTHWFGQLPGVIVLHIIVFVSCLFTFHFVAARLTDGRTAFLSTLLFGCNSFFIGTNAWDYPEALAIFFLLLSFAFAFPARSRNQGWFLVLSGMAWLAVIYTYLAWVVFTPAYLYTMVRLLQDDKGFKRGLLRVCGLTGLGGCLTTLLFWGVYAAMGGSGFFFKNNILQARYLSTLQNNPWVEPDWFWKCTWLVFPALCFCLAAARPLAGRFWFPEKPGAGRHFLWFYFYSFGAMVVLTIRQNRLLAFDYRTSILLPGVFLVLTLLVFHPPESVSNWFFYAVGAAAACLSVAPLGFLFLHHHTPAWSFVIPAMLVLLALACLRLIRGSTRWAWGLSVLLYSSISFAIVPTSKTAAWESTGRDYEMSERVSRAVRIIENRLPQRAIPYLWVDGADNRLGNEFRAVASALIVQSESMLKFPNIDRTLPPGAHIFTLSAQRDVVGGASYLLARRQMPAHLVSQDRVEHAGVAYWITQFQVQPVSIESLRFGFILQPDPKLTLTSDSSGKDERKNLLRYKRLALPAPGIYQFELRGHAPAAIARFGALGSDGARWIEQSATFLQEGPEPVMWFRLAVENNEPVDLAVEVTEPLSVTAQPSLSILRDIDTDHSVTAFEYLVPQSQTGLAIQNGGFEGGLSGWMGDNGNLYSSSDCHRGMCAEFAGLSGTESYVVHWRAVKLDIGGTYEFSAWLRSKTSGSQELSMRVWDPEISQSVARKAVKLTPAWTEYRVQFKNTSANWLAPQFVKPADSPGTFLLDEVAIRKVEHPE